MFSRVLSTAVFVVGVAPQAGAAQGDAGGFWLAFGFGPGTSYSSTWDAGVSPKNGSFGYIQIGRKINDEVGVGLGVTAWGGTNRGFIDYLSRSTWGPTLHWFPVNDGDLSLHAGVGLARANTGFQVRRNKGLGTTAGIRYGVHLIGGLVVQPSVDWLLQVVDFGPDIPLTAHALGISLGFGWH